MHWACRIGTRKAVGLETNAWTALGADSRRGLWAASVREGLRSEPWASTFRNQVETRVPEESEERPERQRENVVVKPKNHQPCVLH